MKNVEDQRTLKGMELLNQNQWLERLHQTKNPAREGYKAMYSSWWNGIVTDPVLMMIPMDDHQVHRGDGVFEAIKVVGGRYWLLAPHLDRMEKSAASIGLKMPFSRAEIEQILLETLRASNLQAAIVRLFLSRGPGTFSPNPYDSVGPQFHVIVTEAKALAAGKYETGVRIGISQMVAKEPWFARIKSCNYLHNVLTKKEAVDAGFDFMVALDANGFLTEGSTENLMMLNAQGQLQCPELHGILAGTTMRRAMQLAEPLRAEGAVTQILEKNFNLQDLYAAREVYMVGTTLDVIAVTTVGDRQIADGRPGPLARRLRELLLVDQASS